MRRKETDIRKRLIEAGREVFLDRGYHQATVKDIVSLADTNIASINYHFGDKLTLFCAVLKVELQPMFRTIPRIAHDPENPQRALRDFVRWYLSRFKPGTELALLLDEISLGECLEVLIQHIRSELSVLFDILQALHPEATSEVIQRNAAILMTLLIHAVRYDLHVEHYFVDSQLTPGPLKHWEDCITELCLQGVQEQKSE